MLEKLVTIASTGEFEDLGGLDIESAAWNRDALEIRLIANHGTGSYSNWNLQCEGVLEYLISEARECGLNVWYTDHPVIDQYTAPRQSLHFSRAPTDADHVIGALWSAHRRLFEDWIPFDRFLNGEMGLRDLLVSGSGLLADGPISAVSIYEAVLQENSCGPSSVAAKPGRIKSAVLAHFGDSYIVAERIHAKQTAA